MKPLFLSIALSMVSSMTFAAPPEHPRLLFGAQDVEMLRAKVEVAPFGQMLQSIRTSAADPVDRSEFSSVLYDMSIRHHAQVYLLTGEPRHAKLAERLALELIADEEFWQDPESKGLTRAAGAWSVAMAYDLCFDAWAPTTRARVSEELYQAAQGLMKSMGAGANNQIANNWQGVRYGTVILSSLSCDEPGSEALARKAYKGLVRHIKANLGTNGWNPEGIGYTIYPATFTAPAGVAAARAGIGDLREDTPQYRQTFWTTLAGTVPMSTQGNALGLRADLSDDHPVWRPHGTAAMAFYYAPQEQLGALRWMYDRFVGLEGDQSWDCDRWGGGLYSVLYYPVDVEPENPSKSLGMNYVDDSHGLVIFRNRFQDEDDIVAVVNAHARQPRGCHGGADTNTLRILGLGSVFATGSGRTQNAGGQTNLFLETPPSRGDGGLGELVDWEFDASGGGHAVTRGSCMGVEDHVRRFVVDFSGECGAPALFVNSDASLNGRVWRLNTPEFNTITTDADSFTITSPVGSSMKVTVLEPKGASFRTGSFERGANSDAPFPYRGAPYRNNKWIEFDCDTRAAVLMTLQTGRAPEIKIERFLHGAVARLGDMTIAYDKQSGAIHLNEDAKRANLATRLQPLRVRGVTALPLSDHSAKIEWLGEKLGATRLRLQRRDGAEASWKNIAAIASDAKSYIEESLASDAHYSWRLVAENAHGPATPSEEAAATTWQKGYALHIEDFAAEAESAFGPWSITNGDRGWSHTTEVGSPRGARAANGFYRTGLVRIDHHNVIYNDHVQCDLSARSAAAEFDIRCLAVTRFGLMLKLNDGRWICSERQYVTSRYEWKTVRVDIPEVKKWSVCQPARLAFGEEVNIVPDDLADIRGIGVWASWPINQKWAHLDQFHLYAKNFEVAR